MMAAFSGCQARTVAAPRGMLTWSHIQPAIGAKIYYRAQTGLIALENTHNMAGGTVTPLPVLEEVWTGAREVGLPVHLDGARVFNAATALGISVAKLTSGFDTVMFCLSKGLGAPVGSVLVGSKKAIEQARIHRKALGGGMRQAGVLAAAGLIALHEMPKRLADDHANARLLAEAVAAQPDVAEIDLEAVQTNIVIFKLHNPDAAAFTAALKQKGILASAIGPHSVRFVTHYDVDRAQCQQAAAITSELLQSHAAVKV
jgi:threonine aldolase